MSSELIDAHRFLVQSLTAPGRGDEDPDDPQTVQAMQIALHAYWVLGGLAGVAVAWLLPAPVDLTRLALGPAERAEIVVECAPGERVVMGTASGPETIDEGDFRDRMCRKFAMALAERSKGALEVQVYPGSSAERAGLREGDVILSIDGQPVNEQKAPSPKRVTCLFSRVGRGPRGFIACSHAASW